jgi:hypothetical protein
VACVRLNGTEIDSILKQIRPPRNMLSTLVSGNSAIACRMTKPAPGQPALVSEPCKTESLCNPFAAMLNEYSRIEVIR